MIVIDTNLLIYSHRSGMPEHAAARKALETASRLDDWAVAVPSILEFWSVVTHPASSGRPSTTSEARAFVGSIVDGGARLLSPGPAFGPRVLETADRLGVMGPRVFDLHIALTALDHGATELWSHDRGFVILPGLRLVDPLSA